MSGFIYDEDSEDYNSGAERQFRLGEEAEAWARSSAARIKNIEAEIAGVKSVVEPLIDRLNHLESKLERARAELLKLMDSVNIKEIKDDRFIIKVRSSEFVKVANKEFLPKEFLRETTVLTPDLQSIKFEIKRGAKIEGCSIEVRNHLTIK